ncbi:restriction endonuclease subunit S [Streptomyces anulatus]|uniref:restriction endonuclease subunit S n=1 Tax=Streptomyces anulatus TaxID=1892 RepID=UPI0030DF7BEC
MNARIGWKALTASEYQPDGYAFLSTPNIKGPDIDFDNVNFISDFRYQESPELQLREGDVLLTKDGFTLGTVNVVRHLPRPATVNGSIAVLRPFNIDPGFLRYTLASSATRHHMWSVKNGMDVLHLFQRDIKKIPILLPPTEEQRRISDFLDVETKRIDTLGAAFQRLQGLTSERSQALIDAAIDRQPSSVPLRYIARFREGPGIMASDFHESGIPLIRISGLQNGEVSLNGCNFLDPEKVAHQWSKFRLRLEDRLISGSATMGGVSVVRNPEVIGAIPYTGLIILRPAQDEVDMEYVESFLHSSQFTRQIDALKTGAAMQHFGPSHLSQIHAPLPSLNDQKQVATEVKESLSFTGQVKQLVHRQLSLLAERRQALITAAVTGQFDVSTASGRNVTDGVRA